MTQSALTVPANSALCLPHERLSGSIRSAATARGIALVPFITAGFPSKRDFESVLTAIDPHAGAIEIGLPFSDPVADGATIQHSSRIALEGGATARWALEELAVIAPRLRAPLVIMSYLNPLMALGDALLPLCAAARVCALIVPDLPLDESGPLADAASAQGIGLIHLATPITPPERLAQLGAKTAGFFYAVTMTGVTGGSGPVPAGITDRRTQDRDDYLARCRRASRVPVCAGFGIRTRQHVAALVGHAEGAIVGSALVEELGRGGDPGRLLAGLQARAE